MASRVDGRKIVAVAFVGTVAMVGVAQVYLPFIADRDKLRGMHEDENMTSQDRMEFEALMRKGAAGDEGPPALKPQIEVGRSSAGSMWKNIRGGSGGSSS